VRISRERLRNEAETTGFREEVLEKVIHLLNLLERIRSHPYLGGRFTLKGGTALNLFMFDLLRLSVDIDLNYTGGADRNTMVTERPVFEKAIRVVCESEDFAIDSFPSDHAGGKILLRYESALGQGGNLHVDLNFVDRVPLWPLVEHNSRTIGSYAATRIPILDIHELAAGKLAALLTRDSPRDLFDAHRLLTQTKLDPEHLRLAFTVYGGMRRKDWREVSVGDIQLSITDVRDRLLPMLRRDHLSAAGDISAWAENLAEECRQAMSVVLPLRENEIEFLDHLCDNGEINPELLTEDPALVNRISRQPMLQWKALNVRKHKGIS